MQRNRVLVLSLTCLCLTACKPTFQGEGTLTITGAPFVPTQCHVTVNPWGLALTDGAGTQLSLTFPPQRLDAWQSFTVVPHVVVAPKDKELLDLGTCGSLMLKGEGWHGEGKRAAGGKLSLACADHVVRGELEFSGCF